MDRENTDIKVLLLGYGSDELCSGYMYFHIKPKTKEALHFRKIFNELFHYKASSVIPYYWMPKWVENVNDPSARILDVY